MKLPFDHVDPAALRKASIVGLYNIDRKLREWGTTFWDGKFPVHHPDKKPLAEYLQQKRRMAAAEIRNRQGKGYQ